jgi:hypothetical protein
MSDDDGDADELTRAVRRAAGLGAAESAAEESDAAGEADGETRIARRPPLLLSAPLEEVTALSSARPAPRSRAESRDPDRQAPAADTDPSRRARRELGLPAVAPLLAAAEPAVRVLTPEYGIRRPPENPPAPAGTEPERRDPAPASVPARRRRRASARGILAGVAVTTVLVMAAAIAGVVVLIAL